jgi:hypothetical protein
VADSSFRTASGVCGRAGSLPPIFRRGEFEYWERSHEEIQVEETLVFDFLHGLGEAFSETIRPQELHRLIVEGATRILDAHGGALYLTDRRAVNLLQPFISNGCPPLVDVPSNILQQAAGYSHRARELFATTLHYSRRGLDRGASGKLDSPFALKEFSEAPELGKIARQRFGSFVGHGP